MATGIWDRGRPAPTLFAVNQVDERPADLAVNQPGRAEVLGFGAGGVKKRLTGAFLDHFGVMEFVAAKSCAGLSQGSAVNRYRPAVAEV